MAPLPNRLLRSTDLVTSEMDGDIVALSISHGNYFGMSGVGTRVWELLEAPQTVDTLVAQILAEFAVEEAVARADVLAFLAELQANALLEPAY